MNDEIFNLTHRMLDESRKGSDLMDFVPRPIRAGQQPVKWLSKQLRGTHLRKLPERKHHYTVCVRTVAWKRRIDFEAAANGL